MTQPDWSPEGIEKMMKGIAADLAKNPEDVRREEEARTKARERTERIEAARPGRLREREQWLKKNVPDELIETRLAARREVEGNKDARQLPAEQTKAMVEERVRFARETMDAEFSSALEKREVDADDLRHEWKKHVDDLKLSLRDRLRFESEANGKEFTEAELNDQEARRNANFREGIRGPSDGEVNHYIEIAKQNGNWPLPELHTGPGSIPKPRDYFYEDFKRSCESPVRQKNSRSDHVVGSPVSGGPANNPRAYAQSNDRANPNTHHIRRLQSLRPQIVGADRVPEVARAGWAEGTNAESYDIRGLPLHQPRLRKRDRLKALVTSISRTIFGGRGTESSFRRATSVPTQATETSKTLTRTERQRPALLHTSTHAALLTSGTVASRGISVSSPTAVESDLTRATEFAARRAAMVAAREAEPRSALNSR